MINLVCVIDYAGSEQGECGVCVHQVQVSPHCQEIWPQDILRLSRPIPGGSENQSIYQNIGEKYIHKRWDFYVHVILFFRTFVTVKIKIISRKYSRMMSS